MAFPYLSLLTFLPLAGAVALAFLPRGKDVMLRNTALFFNLITLVQALVLYSRFDPAQAGMQFVEESAWMPSLGIAYKLGVDGISLLLVVLTCLLGPIVTLSSYRAIEHHVKEFLVSLLVLQTAVIGVFLALDLVLFYFFFEAMLIPMVLIIGIWGGRLRVMAAFKFFLFTLAGSVLMLLAILILYFQAGIGSFDVEKLQAAPALPAQTQTWLFLAFALAFAVKVPLFPFHTWLPDAHGEAPTPGSVVLAALLLKVGSYGFLRFAMPLFPTATHRFLPVLLALAVLGVVYGALMALAQQNLKRLIAYSSVSHLGTVMLGIFSLTPSGVEGSVYQMLSHGVSTAGLFLVAGMLYERRHTLELREYGGLARRIPVLATVFLVLALSSAGLPGTNGFIGEFLVLSGAFRRAPVLALLGGLGVVLGAVYLLNLYGKTMFGPLDRDENRAVTDLGRRELFVLAPLVVLVFVMGLFPDTFLSRIRPAVARALQGIERVR